MTSLYVVLGGKFNPIHYGHTVTSEILAQKLLFKTIFLLPNYTSYQHKSDILTKHKINMLKLAVKNKPLFKINNLEIKKKYLIQLIH
ncbi:hypothetical protein [Buchnera aphidicola]|uniref:hypothetical protein n=1 Tax=Buchnera aphidicola TaxID=9 RepID=UPI000AED1CA3|nr:hypothetical protein [Buchnera aphidicola]